MRGLLLGVCLSAAVVKGAMACSPVPYKGHLSGEFVKFEKTGSQSFTVQYVLNNTTDNDICVISGKLKSPSNIVLSSKVIGLNSGVGIDLTFPSRIVKIKARSSINGAINYSYTQDQLFKAKAHPKTFDGCYFEPEVLQSEVNFESHQVHAVSLDFRMTGVDCSRLKPKPFWIMSNYDHFNQLVKGDDLQYYSFHVSKPVNIIFEPEFSIVE